jgi:hypothetical protein
MAEWRMRVATIVLLVLGLGQAEVEQPAVGIDPMASEAGELVDRNLRDALAERAWWPCGCNVAGRLYGFPERRGGAVGLRERGMRGENNRRHNGAERGAYDPFLHVNGTMKNRFGAQPTYWDTTSTRRSSIWLFQRDLIPTAQKAGRVGIPHRPRLPLTNVASRLPQVYASLD